MKKHTAKNSILFTRAFFNHPILFALVLLTLPGVTAHAETRQSPNIILVLVDDQGWTGTSVQMAKAIDSSRSFLYQTPALEAFAKEGVRFSSGYSSAPNCSPARMSIQTGKTAARLKSTDITTVHPNNYDKEPYGRIMHRRAYVNKPLLIDLPVPELSLEEQTIAELLKATRPEYVSAHIGKWHLGTAPDLHGYTVHSGNTSNVEGEIGDPDPKRTKEVTQQAIDFLKQQAASKTPFFLQVSYYAVHTPLRAFESSILAVQDRQTESRRKGTDRRVNHLHPEYAAMTEELDSAFGTLMDSLDELGLADSTYVIYTSDNGAEIQNSITTNSPLARGKTSVWEGGIRVPFLVRGPGVAPGLQVDLPVVGYDILPTIAEWLEIQDLPADLDGESFAGLLTEDAAEASPREKGLIWYYGAYRNGKHVSPQMAFRKGDIKLYWDIQNDRVDLYDLSLDLSETTNLAGFFPDLADSMLSELKAYMDSVGVSLPKPNPDYDPRLDPGLRLRILEESEPRMRNQGQPKEPAT